MERDVMDIIREKEYIELTVAERDELGDLCSSEDEFNNVKSMFAGISAMDWSNPTPKAETKESLDHLFAQKHPKAAPVWYNAPLAVIVPKGKPFYRQPMIQAAAVGLLIFLAYPFVNSNVMDSRTSQVAALDEEKTSTGTKQLEEDINESIETTSEVNNKTVETRNDLRENNQKVNDIDPTIPVITPTVVSAARFSRDADRDKTISDLKDVDVLASSSAGIDASKPGSTHPDGIFKGDEAKVFSVPASSEPAVFDLLTSTF